MNKKKLGIGIIIVLVVTGVYLLNNIPKREEEALKKGAVLRICGSTTVFPFAKAAARAYKERYPEVVITVSESSTGCGMEKLFAREIDIADATRLPKEEEYNLAKRLSIELEITRIGKDAVVIILHPSKYEFVQKLTKAQVRGIFFEGTITDWSQIHPDLSGKINVYVRDPYMSGTAALFAQKVIGTEKTFVDNAIEIVRTPLVVPTLATDSNGIAYSPLKWVNRTVRVVAYGETPEKTMIPTIESIKDNSYPLTRDMYMITIGKPKGLIGAFIKFVLGKEGQKILEGEGFIGI